MRKVMEDISSKFMFNILKKLHERHNDLSFLPERMKYEKVEKLITNLHDKTEYVIHRRNLKQALNHGLVIKEVNRRIQFNQIAWLKSYIDLNIKVKKNKKYSEKDFFKLMNNGVFGKIMENVRKQRDVKLVTTERKRNYLVSDPIIKLIKIFSHKI